MSYGIPGTFTIDWIPEKLDSGFHLLDSGFYELDSGFHRSGFRIPLRRAKFFRNAFFLYV